MTNNRPPPSNCRASPKLVSVRPKPSPQLSMLDFAFRRPSGYPSPNHIKQPHAFNTL
jgi:hypothetical protein